MHYFYHIIISYQIFHLIADKFPIRVAKGERFTNTNMIFVANIIYTVVTIRKGVLPLFSIYPISSLNQYNNNILHTIFYKDVLDFVVLT